MPTGAATGLQESRPRIAVSGRDSEALTGGLLNLVVCETVQGLYRCEALFGNWGTKSGATDFLYFDRQTLDFGKTVSVKFGDDEVFEGKVFGLEAHFPEGKAPEINILVEDQFQDLRMTRRTRTFIDVTDKDVIEQIAREHGLQTDVDLPGPRYKVLAQVNQSDLAFLRERVRTVDGEIWIEGSTLHAQTHVQRNEGTLPLSYGGTLREFSVIADLAGQRTSVAIGGWDVSAKAQIKHEATESIIRGELNGDTSGASILSTAFGDRKESVAHAVPFTSQEAQAEAEAIFRMSARRFIIGRGVVQAESRLRVGTFVELDRLGSLFNGKYYVSEVRHLFDGIQGLRTQFTAERAGLGQAQ